MNGLKMRSMETFCIVLILIGISILVLVLGLLTYSFRIHPGEQIGFVPDAPGSIRYTNFVASCPPGRMSQPLNSNCISCHHVMATVDRETQTWLQEPVCGNQACHGANYSYQLEISLHDSPFITGSRQSSDQD